MSARGWVVAVAAVFAAITFLVVAAAVLLVVARRVSQPQVRLVCEQYDLLNGSAGWVPSPDLPLWLRHQAALADHCPVDPPWGTLPSDHTPIS